MTSNAQSTAAVSISAFRKLIVGSAALWTAAVLLSFWMAAENERQQAVRLAVQEARTSVQTDIGFRHWVASHGGVYVAPDAQTSPNPYLNVPDRDVVTTNGKHLTLMNPAYVLRQLMQSGFVAKGRITSMKPLNPENAPDEWEHQALLLLEQGETEVTEKVLSNGKAAVRVMAPIRVEQSCLTCHGDQGYKVGDLRGGIDVTIPLEKSNEIASTEIKRLALNHAIFWALVMSGIGLMWGIGKSHIRKHELLTKRHLITQFSIDRAEEPVYWINESGLISYVNDSACSLLGYDEREMLNLHASELNPDHPREKWAEHWRSLKEERFLRFDATLKRKDGSTLPVEISANYLSHEGQEFDVAFVRDMSSHKEATVKIAHLTDIYAALSQTNKAIIRSKSRQELFDAIVRISVDFGHFRMAWIGVVDDASRAIVPVAWAGEGIAYLDGLKVSADADSPYGQGPSGQCIRAGEHRVAENFFGTQITAPWQKRAAFFNFNSSAAFPLKNQGKTIGTLSLYSDVPEFFTDDLIELLTEMTDEISFALDRMDLEASHRQHEAEQKELVERLMASNTELERFAYVASHDLQEPLRTIVSFTQLLDRHLGDKLPPEDRENFEFVVGAAKRMGLLINDLLAFSRVSAKGVSFSRISLTAACSAAQDNLREVISQNHAEITVGQLPEVIGDDVQLMQVFQNLIGNAVKFRHPDRKPQISIDAEQKDGKWQIAVRDNGIGIADTTQDIFEIFRRLHAGNQYPGSGVGLAICKRIITQHGGQIWVEPEPGHGATFRFTLPV
ncbi:ATP-binding protein [Paramagnetospirillum caucaseum]|uniref:ATP-binding protein n=1 Tax=Paramagnetospirillum caucaseum TaxID=1244869 RepID=UPI00034B3019|nr:ATP-binding protein [Paramagnetospirillum caucaseum]